MSPCPNLERTAVGARGFFSCLICGVNGVCSNYQLVDLIESFVLRENFETAELSLVPKQDQNL